ncbi:TetR/AcrR family transcriptional regulator [Gordonia sp. TBRC 11910]|uniref:TetR/AcrR family transcriptional regulator n=1 Tax=Gordonia asplenii TaxID=2725283 RepID=A0A848L5P1_9ACTN|nr:TetR/AcrR family transcriptional regulator [Gordonia asplenii]NMO04335.1 TetR/AcrR family transcriptional regulator [Gordonia asplenii]
MTSTRSYAGLSMAERKAQRRQRFLDAGLEVFGTVGYAKASISALCAQAGLSRRQFYEEFASREDLLIEVYDAVQGGARTAVVEAISVVEPPELRALATAAMTAYVDAVGSDPRRTRVGFIEVGGVSDRVEQHRIDGRLAWTEFFRTTLAAVVPDSSPADFDYAATAFIGALTAVVHRWGTSSPRPDRADVVALLSSMLLNLAEGH